MKLEELKKIVEGATPKAIDWKKAGFYVIPKGERLRLTDPRSAGPLIGESDAQFYATFNPERVSRLLAVVEAAFIVFRRFDCDLLEPLGKMPAPMMAGILEAALSPLWESLAALGEG